MIEQATGTVKSYRGDSNRAGVDMFDRSIHPCLELVGVVNGAMTMKPKAFGPRVEGVA
jgi:hypothetical protein